MLFSSIVLRSNNTLIRWLRRGLGGVGTLMVLFAVLHRFVPISLEYTTIIFTLVLIFGLEFLARLLPATSMLGITLKYWFTPSGYWDGIKANLFYIVWKAVYLFVGALTGLCVYNWFDLRLGMGTEASIQSLGAAGHFTLTLILSHFGVMLLLMIVIGIAIMIYRYLKGWVCGSEYLSNPRNMASRLGGQQPRINRRMAIKFVARENLMPPAAPSRVIVDLLKARDNPDPKKANERAKAIKTLTDYEEALRRRGIVINLSTGNADKVIQDFRNLLTGPQCTTILNLIPTIMDDWRRISSTYPDDVHNIENELGARNINNIDLNDEAQVACLLEAIEIFEQNNPGLVAVLQFEDIPAGNNDALAGFIIRRYISVRMATGGSSYHCALTLVSVARSWAKDLSLCS